MSVKRYKPRITISYLCSTFLKFLVKVTSIMTLFMCPITVVFTAYNTFILFDFQKALIGCIILFSMPYINSKL